MTIRIIAVIGGSMLLANCGGGQRPQTPHIPQPIVTTAEIAVPVSSGCVPSSIGPAPTYPDTDAALKAAPDAARRYQLMAEGRPLRQARLNELEPVVTSCPKANP
jgi:hypothetical protein